MRKIIFFLIFSLQTPLYADLRTDLEALSSRPEHVHGLIALCHRSGETTSEKEFIAFAKIFKESLLEGCDAETVDLVFFISFSNIGHLSNHFEYVKASQLTDFIKQDDVQRLPSLRRINYFYAYFIHLIMVDVFDKANAHQEDPDELREPLFNIYKLMRESKTDHENYELVPSAENTTSPYLFYTELALALKTLKSPTQKAPGLSRLALTYLVKLLEGQNFIKNQKIETIISLNMLLKNILENWSEGTANYAWFTYILHQMLVIEDYKDQFTKELVNTYFDFYYLSFLKQISEGESKLKILSDLNFFKDSIDNFGTFNGRNRITPKAIIDLFPHVVFLPFPFKLSVDDINHQCTELGWWLTGFALGPKSADNLRKMSPLGYEYHDKQHWGIHRNLSTCSIEVTNFTPENVAYLKEKAVPEIRKHVQEGVSLFKEWKLIFKHAEDLETTPDHKKFFALFRMLITHDQRTELVCRFDLIKLLTTIRKKTYSFYEDWVTTLLLKDIGPYFSKDGNYEDETADSFQELSDYDRREALKPYLNAFGDACRAAPTYEAISERTYEWLNAGLVLPGDTYVPLTEARIFFDPVTFLGELPHNINYKRQGNIHRYVFDPHLTEGRQLLENFKKTVLNKSFNVPGRIVYGHCCVIDRPRTVLRFVFHDLLPDGREIKIENPFWIEEFVVMPKVKSEDQES